MYDLAALERELAGSIFADRLHFTACTASTNLDAVQAARAGASHGAVFFADQQSAGRGRGDHGWVSSAGEGLYVSVVLRPDAPLARWTWLPFCAGLAAIDAIRTSGEVVADLRWPNDVLVGSQKVCGILVEAGSDVRGAGFAVAGIGINVHQREFSGDLAALATSLDLATGRIVNRQSLLARLLESLQRETEMLTDERMAQRIPARVEAASTWLRGRRVRVHGPQACEGVTAGLDEHGFLRVMTSAGIVVAQTGGIRAAEMGSEQCC